MSNAEGYSVPGRRGDRWGFHGRRRDAAYFNPPDTYSRGDSGRCKCFHELAPLDWAAINEAVANRWPKLWL